MFKQSVNSTMMTSESANMFFTNITGENYGGDTTFLATLRALVAPRIPDGDTVFLHFGRSDHSLSIISNSPAEIIVESICEALKSEDSGRIYIHNLANYDEANNVACIELLKQKFCSFYNGWQYHEKISVFYQKSFKVVCFINPKTKSVALFVDRLNLQKLHYLQMSILAFLPWYFDTQKGMTEAEMALVYSLRERSSEKYESCIAEISKQYDFESGRIKHLLAGFETEYEKRERDSVRRDISFIDRDIKDLDKRFADKIKRRNDMCIRLLGLEQRIASGAPSELMEYFLCNRRLYLESVSGTAMNFAVRDYMSYFDEDAAQTYINNENSTLYSGCCSSLPKSDMKKLLAAIFIDQTIRLRFCAAYTFDLNGSVIPQYHHSFGDGFKNFMPNPHINDYECMGNYKRTVNEALVRRDYITALEQCVASAKSLNLHDGVVLERFISQFTNGGGAHCKILELPDGQIVSPINAIKWIKSQEAEEDTQSSSDSAERMPDVPVDAADRIAAARAATRQELEDPFF